MPLFRFRAGFTCTRPIIVDEYITHVIIDAPNANQAFDQAFDMVFSRPKVEMVTRLDRI